MRTRTISSVQAATAIGVICAGMGRAMPTMELMGNPGTTRKKQRREDVCAAIAAQSLNARFRRTDTGGGVQMHDFELIFDDGSIDVLEVCSFTDAAVRELWELIDRLDEPAKKLTSNWTVSLATGARLKGLLPKLEPHLEMFERAGVTRFIDAECLTFQARVQAATLAGQGDPSDVARLEAMLALARLGVRDAMKTFTASGEQPRIFVAAGAGGAGNRELINRVVQHVSLKRDNRLKLQRPQNVRRRHIFIPIDTSAGVAWSVAAGEPPDRPPRLPAGVDYAWVVGASGRVLQFERGRGWQSVMTDDAVWDDPARWALDSEGDV
jgi:hypothetical protein